MIKKLLLKILDKHASHWLVLFIDVFLCCFAYLLSYGIRFSSFTFNAQKLLFELPFVAVLSLVCFWLVGSNKGIIRHTGTRDAFNIFIGVTVFSSAVIFVIILDDVFKIFTGHTISKSITLIHYFVSIFILVVSRFVFKRIYEIILQDSQKNTKVLIYGAGESGLLTYGALRRDKKQNYEVFGFIDDDKRKVGKKINRSRIYGIQEITESFVSKHKISEVIISMQVIESEKLLGLTDKLMGIGLQVKIVPPISKWIHGDLEANQIKQIRIEDLLNREPISIDNPIVKKEINNTTILITGAGGSIGSEIARQITIYNNYKHLVLVDQAESDLYDLQQELHRKGTIIDKLTCIVADVRDKTRMQEIFTLYEPSNVFHVAAYKHVPLMEESPYEAVKVNVCGTKTIADLSITYNVSRFVMISTDKAVNPTNVMGATKRVAEMYISCLSKEKHKTKFTTTRFGNVLGSNGSVIPLFRKQIENGGPLTVTHKEITRFFMTIPEACQLVLEAGTMGIGGEIYIFDMGRSVKIFDLAKRMISLSGLNYPEDIDIKITGLRPGEKLYEELLTEGENITPTHHEKIMIAKVMEIDNLVVKNKIEELCKINLLCDHLNTVKKIKEIVPEFISNNSIYSDLDSSK